MKWELCADRKSYVQLLVFIIQSVAFKCNSNIYIELTGLWVVKLQFACTTSLMKCSANSGCGSQEDTIFCPHFLVTGDIDYSFF